MPICNWDLHHHPGNIFGVIGIIFRTNDECPVCIRTYITSIHKDNSVIAYWRISELVLVNAYISGLTSSRGIERIKERNWLTNALCTPVRAFLFSTNNSSFNKPRSK